MIASVQNDKFNITVPYFINSNKFPPLTPRELQCLSLIAQGLNIKKIAEQLFLSSETVNTHTKSIRKKLECKNITEAVTKAFIYGYFNLLPG